MQIKRGIVVEKEAQYIKNPTKKTQDHNFTTVWHELKRINEQYTLIIIKAMIVHVH